MYYFIKLIDLQNIIIFLCSLYQFNRNGDIAIKEQYCYQADQSSSWAKWGVSLVTSSVAWSWKKVMKSLPDTTETLQTFVVPSVLKVTILNCFYISI
jgi:hypothetical protein